MNVFTFQLIKIIAALIFFTCSILIALEPFYITQ